MKYSLAETAVWIALLALVFAMVLFAASCGGSSNPYCAGLPGQIVFPGDGNTLQANCVCSEFDSQLEGRLVLSCSYSPSSTSPRFRP